MIRRFWKELMTEAHLTRIVATTLFLLASPGLLPGTARAGEPGTVIRGKVRFQSLSDDVIRMEFSPKNLFVDEPSVGGRPRRLSGHSC